MNSTVIDRQTRRNSGKDPAIPLRIDIQTTRRPDIPLGCADFFSKAYRGDNVSFPYLSRIKLEREALENVAKAGGLASTLRRCKEFRPLAKLLVQVV